MKKFTIGILLTLSLTTLSSTVQAKDKTLDNINSNLTKIEQRKEVEEFTNFIQMKALQNVKEKNKVKITFTDLESQKQINQEIKMLLKESKNNKYNVELVDTTLVGKNNEPIDLNNTSISTMSITSPPTSEVSIPTPRFYKSSQGMYIVSDATNKAIHTPVSPFTVNVGGDDGHGITFDGTLAVTISSSSFYTLSTTGSTYNNNLYPYISSSLGVYYRFQDKSYDYDYTSKTRMMYVWPNFIGYGTTVVRTHFTHTWDTTSISSVSANKGYFSVSFNKTSNAWDGQSVYGVSISF